MRTVAIALLMICLAGALFLARYMVLTALIGIGLGVLFVPALNWMSRRFRIPRGLGGLVLVFGILAFLAGVSVALGMLVSDQVVQLQEKGPQIYQSFVNELNSRLSRIPWLKAQIQNAHPERLFENFGKWALGGIQTGMAAIAGLVIVIAISIFTAVSSQRYFKGVLSAFPARLRPRAAGVLHASGKSLRSWAKAQLLDMAAVGAATALGLWIIGIDYWIVLGLLAGLMDVIPYVGPVSAALITTIMTLGTEPDKVPWVMGLFLLIQQLEGNLLIPVIMREEADLPEVPLLILIMMMSAWFGLLGALLAAPMLAVGRTVYLMTYKARMDQDRGAVRNGPPLSKVAGK